MGGHSFNIKPYQAASQLHLRIRCPHSRRWCICQSIRAICADFESYTHVVKSRLWYLSFHVSSVRIYSTVHLTASLYERGSPAARAATMKATPSQHPTILTVKWFLWHKCSLSYADYRSVSYIPARWLANSGRMALKYRVDALLARWHTKTVKQLIARFVLFR